MAIKAPFLRSIHLNEQECKFYPFSLPIFRSGQHIIFTNPVTILCGENGSGKSTILEAIALHCGFSITSGGKAHRTFPEKSDVKPLAAAMKFSWSVKVSDGFFMRAESFYSFASYIDLLAEENGNFVFSPYGGTSLNKMSHGEAFLALFNNRLGKKGIFILDEPEAALSPQRQLALLCIIKRMEETGSAQFIIATHSPLLMAYPGATVLHLDDEIIEKSYKTTTHFRVMARFFSDPDSYIDDLLKK